MICTIPLIRPELCPDCKELGILIKCRQGEVMTIDNRKIGKCNQWKGGCEYR